MNASAKEAQINWLKDEAPTNTYRILSNVRFDAMINKLDLMGKDNKKMEVISIIDDV